MSTFFRQRLLTRSHTITDPSLGSVRAPLAESLSRLRRRTASALLASAAALCALPAIAADVTSTWNTGSGNWGVNANWTNVPALGGFPNNGNLGVATYDAVLANGGTITLDQNITIRKFTLSSGTVTGGFNLTLNDNLTWAGGVMAGSGTTDVAGTATIMGTGGDKALNRTLNNTGTITYSASDASNPLCFGRDNRVTGVLNNNGTFNTTGGGDFAKTSTTSAPATRSTTRERGMCRGRG